MKKELMLTVLPSETTVPENSQHITLLGGREIAACLSMRQHRHCQYLDGVNGAGLLVSRGERDIGDFDKNYSRLRIWHRDRVKDWSHKRGRSECLQSERSRCVSGSMIL